MKSDFDDRLRDEEVWWLAREIETSAGQRALDDLLARKTAEDDYADAVLNGVLESEARFAAANVATDERFRTGGVVRRLCKAAYDQLDHAPLFAMTLAKTAALIADGLPDDYYPARGINELRGTAWKHVSTAYRYMGRFQSGHEALDRAEEAYRRLPVSIIQLATVKLGRSGLHWEQQDYATARALAQSASRDFAQCGDVAGELDAREYEALSLLRQGNARAAREIYRIVFERAEAIGDAASAGRAAKNLGVIDSEGGNFESASMYLFIALRLFESLEQQVMILKTRKVIARLSLDTGNPSEALRQLEPLIDELTRFGLAIDSADCQLARAEALLLLRRHDDASKACKALVAFFREVGVLRDALTAASLLSEAAAQKALTREKINRVREVLRELQISKD